ncbi:MAG TPA: HDIG domain-containing protein [Candidatus Dormibacteraeota bacterium]|nr:HDIG domain-containing protein [Candidatus Dormibacteraeota bacterium]
MARPLNRASYRVRQAFAGTFGRVDPGAATEAANELPVTLRPLFDEMRARDQRHAILVLQRLGPATEVLRHAALLHDVGKVRAYLGTPGRTLVVLAGATHTLGLVSRLPAIGPRVSRYVRHPQLGAEMLRDAGASALLVEIVAEHQAARPRHPETLRLQAADGDE